MDKALEVRSREAWEDGRTEGRAEAAVRYEARIAELERQLAGRR
jgi:hypothetical protein